MKRSAFFILIVFVGLSFGCATQKDIDSVRNSMYIKTQSMEEELASLKRIVAELETSNQKNEDMRRVLGERQADMGADLVGLRNNVQGLRGATEELKAELAVLNADMEGSTLRELPNKLEVLSKRVAYLENFLELADNKKTAGKEAGETPPEKEGVTGNVNLDKEKAYADAYKSFKDGNYSESRDKFSKFLGSYANTEYSDNAQFWIAESYYFEQKYEKAILEYENVIKNYPEGNKVPNAFLKQALSFLKLGDKASARLLLQRVIKDYPNTNPARIARAKLVEIK